MAVKMTCSDACWRQTSDSEAEYVVRICGDNPFLRAKQVETLVDFALDERGCDYASYMLPDGTPSILSHTGLFAEVIRRSKLARIAEISDSQRHHEHMTSHILDHMPEYDCRLLEMPPSVQSVDELRLTVDTENDFRTTAGLFGEVVDRFGIEFTIEQLISVVHDNAAC